MLVRRFDGISRAAQGRNDYILAMFENLNDFIKLDRTFRDLAISDQDGDEAKMVRLRAREASTSWAELLAEPRVIVLAEAGSGKTEEIRHICHRQRAEDKPAFFLRIEHVVDDFETSFEEGDLEEFEAWLKSLRRRRLFAGPA